MTEDDIRKMQAGRELDILIMEKIFGFRRQENYGMAGGYFWVGNGVSFGDMPANEVIEYSTDISAAWEVVDKMRENTCIDFSLSEGFNASFLVEGGWVNATESTMPLAICRAALLAVTTPNSQTS